LVHENETVSHPWIRFISHHFPRVRFFRPGQSICGSLFGYGHRHGGSVGGKTIQFDFRITQYTTDEEVQNSAQLVEDKGTDALWRALEKEDKGRINVVGSTGNQIAVARKRQQGPETVITIVTARTMPFLELYNNGWTTDYPFGYLQVRLSANGVGTGQIMAAARIRFDKKKGEYQIESFGNRYIKATSICPRK
jgi:hypothetical protein